MGQVLIKGGRIIDPSRGVDRVGDLLIEDGKIAGVEQVIERPEGTHVIEAAGLVVSPGFHRPALSPARTGSGVQGDDRDRDPCGCEGWVHHGLRDAEHRADDAHPRDSGVRAWKSARRGRCASAADRVRDQRLGWQGACGDG